MPESLVQRTCTGRFKWNRKEREPYDLILEDIAKGKKFETHRKEAMKIDPIIAEEIKIMDADKLSGWWMNYMYQTVPCGWNQSQAVHDLPAGCHLMECPMCGMYATFFKPPFTYEEEEEFRKKNWHILSTM